MRTFFTLLILFAAAISLQMSVISRIQLLSGNADLVFVILAAVSLQERARSMLWWSIGLGWLMGNISATPWYIFVGAYLLGTAIARLLARRVWQAPLLALLSVTLVGVFLLHGLTFVYRVLFETALSFTEVFSQVILPSLLLNLLIAIVLYPLLRDLIERLYPLEV